MACIETEACRSACDNNSRMAKRPSQNAEPSSPRLEGSIQHDTDRKAWDSSHVSPALADGDVLQRQLLQPFTLLMSHSDRATDCSGATHDRYNMFDVWHVEGWSSKQVDV